MKGKWLVFTVSILLSVVGPAFAGESQAETTQSLSQGLAKTQEVLKQQQEFSNEKISQLQQQNQQLGQQLKQIGEQLDKAEQNMSAVLATPENDGLGSIASATSKPQMTNNVAASGSGSNTQNNQVAIANLTSQSKQKPLQQYVDEMHIAIGMVLIGLLLLLYAFFGRTSGQAKKTEAKIAPNRKALVSSDEMLDEDEYDFMNSEEAWPVKLDLARAYIDMGDYQQAREILDEIKQRPELELVEQAQALAEQLPHG